MEYPPYIKHVNFEELFLATLGHTMLGYYPLESLFKLATSANLMPGVIAETGVWKGGSLYTMASAAYYKKCYGFDSWEGLEEPTINDGKTNVFKEWGKQNIPLELFRSFGDRVTLIKGRVQDTLQHYSDLRFSLVHMDCDLYEATKTAVEFFAPRMVKGGYMVFDDYFGDNLPGVKKAIDPIINDSNLYDKFHCGHLIIRVK